MKKPHVPWGDDPCVFRLSLYCYFTSSLFIFYVFEQFAYMPGENSL
jgi:hypothetical protein